MKYIDADLLRKEIDHRIDILEGVSIKCAKNDDTEMHAYYHGKAVSLQELLSFIDFLQQEQPEVDLEEEVKRYYSDNFAYISSDQPTLSILTNIARHFAEWGAEHLKR